MTARQMALQILYKVNEEKAFSNIVLDKELTKNLLEDKRDIALVTELVNGTIKYKIHLDFIIQQFSKEKLEKLSPWVLNILRMSVYQLLFLDKIPESAAVNEGVNLTKKYSHQGSVRFVNAVLRNVIRKKSEIYFPSKEEGSIDYLSVTYSFPKWLVEFFIKEYGFENTEKMLIFFNQIPKTWIRANMLKTSMEDIEILLKELNINYVKSEFIPEALQIEEKAGMMRLKQYREGLFSVQDETSMFAVDILDPQPGENNIDLCSAPGGKTAFIAERMKNKGSIEAIELHEHRLKTILVNCERTGADIVKGQLGDAREVHMKYGEEFDRVLVDVPCSGLGVLGKRPDLRYQADSCRFDEIVTIQREILDSASKILKKGGVLVYATCTLNKQENQEIISEFLLKNENFERDSLGKYQDYLDNDGNLQTLPFRDNKNGFFVARLRKRGI